ncbi:hypothetical protein SK128_004325 [Halocaridina rubra]|uniref:GDP-fucose pyrophosphorylase domain-containing protein n=1 Tax=Halocaridina rubra TaxID=373956 RepID=A0AAN8WVE2_HALRR
MFWFGSRMLSTNMGIPLQVSIFVISDPVGQKLGVGGSTLHVLTELLKNYSNELYTKNILIIHSGGSSQRLPSYSVIGKIFTPVACKGLQCDSSVPQMLKLKFAMYLPFCQLLEPGVFVTCADDIETYCLDLDALDLEALKTADVVALAHPSDVKMGEGHGVYVFEGREVETASFVNAVKDCSEVLQKPSESAMREKGAVFMRDNNGTLKEKVWSDSVFWFSGSVCKKLVTWMVRMQFASDHRVGYLCPLFTLLGHQDENCKTFRLQELPF